MPPVFRFAPSPNGYLHLGHALSALLNADRARSRGGRLLLRIEDIDATRCRPEFEAAIYDDLAWLGIAWDAPVRRQSDHLDDYRVALARLDAFGLIYPSFESRAEITRLVAERDTHAPMPQGGWPRDPDGAPLYPGTAKTLSATERARRIEAGEPYALRLDMQKALAIISSFRGASEPGIQERPLGASLDSGPGARRRPGMTSILAWHETGAGPAGEIGTITADPAIWGDVVLARKEQPTSYHLSVVVDDALQGVTHVVRGNDLFHATGLHRLLQTLLDLPSPEYHHHRLILDADGNKLSKSTQATGLRELRAQGQSAADIRHRVGLD